MFAWWRRRRRARLLARERLEPEAWDWVLRRLPLLARLDEDRLARLRDLVLVFMHEKRFVPLEGLELELGPRYLIAAQACLLVLELGIDAYRGWTSIYVFPGLFRAREEERDWDPDLGPPPDPLEAMAGLAVPGGAVVLSLADVRDGSRSHDGFNPVLHEFAHKLDMLDGDANGVPLLPAGMDPRRWARVFEAAYADFCDRVDRGEDTELDDYAAESPAEFFAVLVEDFLERPSVVEACYPEVAALLEGFLGFRLAEDLSRPDGGRENRPPTRRPRRPGGPGSR